MKKHRYWHQIDRGIAMLANDQNTISNQAATINSGSIPVVREDAIIKKQLVETGKLHVNKQVQEQRFVAEVPLSSDNVTVKTIELNQVVDTIPPAIRYEGDTTIISVLKEVMVVRTMLEKEIHITRQQSVENYKQQVSLKSEVVTVTRESSSEPSKTDKPTR